METVVAALAANALVLVALTYLVRSLLTHRLDKDIAEFKNTLERTSAREIESYRAQLEKDRLRLQISYGGIFEKQAEAILALHTAIVDLSSATSQAIHVGGDIKERQEHFRKPWAELRRTHQMNRILLPPVVDEAMMAFLDRIFRGVLGYMTVEARDFTRVSEKEFEKLSERQDKAMEIINKEVPELQEKLVSEMRKVIGVVASEF